MIIEKETNTIHIRMGNKYKFISSITLNNGTRLVNMQCSLLEPTPSEEELKRFENEASKDFTIDTKAELNNLKELGII